MLVLGIESTCDETACAVVRNGREMLSNAIASQIALHAPYGGVVPELACRSHVDAFPSVLERALKEAKITLQELDLIAVAQGPGLIGALLVGLHMAKGLSLGLNIPLVGVNHIEAHLAAPFIDHEIALPALGLVLSGGHTSLVFIKEIGSYELIGETQDDAVGEAFDKVAKMLGLPYPGGPEIEKRAKVGNPHRYSLKGGKIKKQPLDFSFSGLKTAVLYQLRGQNCSHEYSSAIEEEKINDIAASFQQAAFTDILEKTHLAIKTYACKSVVVGGGVSNNQSLRARLCEECTLPVFWPPRGLSLDNGAMIAALGYHIYKKRGGSPHDLNAMPRMSW